jgi:hypothetical protein
MCIENISSSTPVARKEYPCDASDWILQDMSNLNGELSFSEWRQVVKAKRKRWKIRPGERYVKQVNKTDGELFTFRAIPEIHEICLKLDLYEC